MPESITNASYGDRVLWVSLLVNFIFLLIIIHLVRKRKLTEKFALVWMVIPILLILFSSNRGLLEILAAVVGIYYAPAIMIPILFALFIIVSLYFTVKMSKAETEIKSLAQELALLRHQVEQQKHGGLVAKDFNSEFLQEFDGVNDLL